MSQQNTNNPTTPGRDAKQDPKPGVLGEHPVGVSVGAIATGAAAGAVGGAVAGPVGAVAGATVGAVVGGLAGNTAAEAVNPNPQVKH